MNRVAAAVIVASVITGCGGGDSTPAVSAPPAPVVNWSAQSAKSFQFMWSDVIGETQYRLLEDATGSAGYTQVATVAADATSYLLADVSLPRRINARYILQACNSSGCTDSAPVFVGNTLAAVGYLKASNTGAGDAFGITVALSGDGSTLAVGAWKEDSGASGVSGDQLGNGATDAGAVYVFSRSGASWSQQAYLKASNTGSGDLFGSAVALSSDGSTLAVGARLEDSNGSSQGDNTAQGAGAVYIFARTGTAWSQQAYVKAVNVGGSDLFGSAVALSSDGNTLAVGALGEASADGNQADNSALNAGAAYVYARIGGNWVNKAYLKASNIGANDNFGAFLALSGDGQTLAVSAFWEDSNANSVNGNQADNSAPNSGAVYVFTRDAVNDIWNQQAYVKATNAGAGDLFGFGGVGLSSDGSTLAVGALSEDSNATGVGGNQSDNSAAASGAAYVFTRSGTTWSQQAYIKASNAEAGDGFGFAVGLSTDGNALAVGAPYEDSNANGVGGNQGDNSAADSGAAYLFTRSAGTWSQLAYVKASNTGAGDSFGTDLRLSGNGSTLAVATELEDSSAAGLGGDQGDNSATDSGAVYLY